MELFFLFPQAAPRDNGICHCHASTKLRLGFKLLYKNYLLKKEASALPKGNVCEVLDWEAVHVSEGINFTNLTERKLKSFNIVFCLATIK